MNMNNKRFLKGEKPLLVCMVQAKTPERIKELITQSIPEGAEAFGMQFCKMEPQYRNKETYKELFDFVNPLPTYVTNYRRSKFNENMTDDELAAGLVELAECGATLCDVMGDFYAPCADELAMDKDAVKKQMELIDRLHNVGADVLMSSHVLKFTPAERVLEIALEHQKRGADICKIVTGSKTMEEQIENLRITNLLKENLEIPFLFLAGGESYISRRMGFAFGNCMTLCVHEYDELSTAAQPLLRDMKTLHNLF